MDPFKPLQNSLQRFRESEPAASAGRVRRFSLLLLLAALPLHASSLSTAQSTTGGADDDNDDGASCSASAEKSPLPGFMGVAQVIPGPGNHYHATNLGVPEVVALGLACTDTDTLLLKCTSDCRVESLGGYWTATWSIATANGGVFVNPNGGAVNQIPDAQRVVYLPPRDLDCGQHRDIDIVAHVWDPGPDPATRDAAVDVKFTVHVERASAPDSTYYTVDIQPGNTPPPGQPPPACAEPISSCCQFIGNGTTTLGSAITGKFTQFPIGMLTGDKRMLCVEAQDTDAVTVECGFQPCPSTYSTAPFPDGVTYSWQVMSGPATITGQGRSAILTSTGTPGAVDIQVTIDDCTGFCFNDAPLTIMKTTYIYAVDFIKSNNVALRNLNPAAMQFDEGLSISRKVTNIEMNRCGGPASTFVGPIPADIDPRTYRVQVERGANALETFTVRMRTSHAWESVDPYEYEGQSAFDETLATIPSGNVFRTADHLRFVSNARPMSGSQPNPPGVYDQEACPHQAIYAHPGDWVTASLLVDGQSVGSRELPIERPWRETSISPSSEVQSIRQAKVAWFTTAGSVPPGTGAFHVRRLTEDFAQAAIRGTLQMEISNIGPYTNTLYYQTTNVWPPTTLPGDVVFYLTPSSGISVKVEVTLNAGWTRFQIADAIVGAINSKGFSATAYHAKAVNATEPCFIVINRQSNIGISAVTGSANLAMQPAPTIWNDSTLTTIEAQVLGLNLKPNVTASQDTLDTIVQESTNVGVAGSPGATFGTDDNTVPESEAPGLVHTTFLSPLSGDALDAQYGQTATHEWVHLLKDDGDHETDPQYLMTPSNLYPAYGNDPIEDPAIRRRLTWPQCSNMRDDGTAFLTMPCVPIPERKL